MKAVFCVVAMLISNFAWAGDSTPSACRDDELSTLELQSARSLDENFQNIQRPIYQDLNIDFAEKALAAKGWKILSFNPIQVSGSVGRSEVYYDVNRTRWTFLGGYVQESAQCRVVGQNDWAVSRVSPNRVRLEVRLENDSIKCVGLSVNEEIQNVKPLRSESFYNRSNVQGINVCTHLKGFSNK